MDLEYKYDYLRYCFMLEKSRKFTISHTENKQMTGKIRRLVTDKGFGFISDEDGKEYFFHKSGCFENWNEIFEGDRVSFDVEESDKGPRAKNVRTVRV